MAINLESFTTKKSTNKKQISFNITFLSYILEQYFILLSKIHKDTPWYTFTIELLCLRLEFKQIALYFWEGYKAHIRMDWILISRLQLTLGLPIWQANLFTPSYNKAFVQVKLHYGLTTWGLAFLGCVELLVGLENDM